MKLSVGNTTSLKRMDDYGIKFDEEIKHMKEEHMVSVARPKDNGSTPQPDGSFKVVLDNVDLRVITRDMTSDRQNKDIHWVNHSAVKNRVTDSGNERQPVDLLELDNSQLLPSPADHEKLRKDFTHMVCRVIAHHIPCLQFLQEVCLVHIPHRYSQEMCKKSDKV